MTDRNAQNPRKIWQRAVTILGVAFLIACVVLWEITLAQAAPH